MDHNPTTCVNIFLYIKHFVCLIIIFAFILLFQYYKDSSLELLNPAHKYLGAGTKEKKEDIGRAPPYVNVHKTKPNIVMIVADDLGWNDISWHNKIVKSPHLENLAREGVRLEQHYGQHICTPSRGALLTGL